MKRSAVKSESEDDHTGFQDEDPDDQVSVAEEAGSDTVTSSTESLISNKDKRRRQKDSNTTGKLASIYKLKSNSKVLMLR